MSLGRDQKRKGRKCQGTIIHLMGCIHSVLFKPLCWLYAFLPFPLCLIEFPNSFYTSAKAEVLG